MRVVLHNSLYFIITIVFFGCGQVHLIDEDTLKDIIVESMVTTSISDQNMEYRNVDTLDFYSVVLSRHGYTMDDMKYTISEMAGRKSNPLKNIFAQISSEMDNRSAQTRHRFHQLNKFDTLSNLYNLDTLLNIDTLLTGRQINRFKVEIIYPSAGHYDIQFDYQSHDSYELGARMVNFQEVQGSTVSRNYNKWINRSFKPDKFSYQYTIDSLNIDTLNITFEQSSLSFKGKRIQDTSYIDGFVVLYTPNIEHNRKVYFEAMTGLKLEIILKGFKYNLSAMMLDTLSLRPKLNKIIE